MTASATVSTIAAESLAFTAVSFDGVAQVRTIHGAVPMLKFSMTSLTCTGRAALTVKHLGHSFIATGSSFGFTGHVVLYTTKLSGDLNGKKVTYTPANPPGHLNADMVLTNAVASQPVATADSLRATGLSMAAS